MCGQMVAFCDGPHVLCSSKEDPQAERAGGLCRGAIGCVAVSPPQRWWMRPELSACSLGFTTPVLLTAGGRKELDPL